MEHIKNKYKTGDLDRGPQTTSSSAHSHSIDLKRPLTAVHVDPMREQPPASASIDGDIVRLFNSPVKATPPRGIRFGKSEPKLEKTMKVNGPITFGAWGSLESLKPTMSWSWKAFPLNLDKIAPQTEAAKSSSKKRKRDPEDVIQGREVYTLAKKHKVVARVQARPPVGADLGKLINHFSQSYSLHWSQFYSL